MRTTRLLGSLILGVTLLLVLILADTAAHAQQPPAPDTTVRNLTFQLANPPLTVPACTVQSVNGPGRNQYFYWIVVEYQIGNSNVFGPCSGATTFNNLQDNVTAFAKIAFPAMTGTGPSGNPLEYDVLRTTTPTPPTGTSNVGVSVTNFYPASGSINDVLADGGPIGYTVNTFDPSTVASTFNNITTGAGTSGISGGANGINFIGPVSSSTYIVLKGVPPGTTAGGLGFDSTDTFFKVSNGGGVTSVPKVFRLSSDYTNSTTSDRKSVV